MATDPSILSQTLRRARGLLGMAVLWGLAWIPVGLVAIGITRLRTGFPLPAGVLLRMVAEGALYGALSGLVFGGLVAIAERRKTVETLSPGRFAAWGILAALAPPALVIGSLLLGTEGQLLGPRVTPMLVQVFALQSALGAACAGGLLYLARRGARPWSSGSPEPPQLG